MACFVNMRLFDTIQTKEINAYLLIDVLFDVQSIDGTIIGRNSAQEIQSIRIKWPLQIIQLQTQFPSHSWQPGIKQVKPMIDKVPRCLNSTHIRCLVKIQVHSLLVFYLSSISKLFNSSLWIIYQ